jgi:hypothetical protein
MKCLRFLLCMFSVLSGSIAFEPRLLNAEVVQVNVTVENLASPNSISFAPLRLGFGNGTFDAFNLGQTAAPSIISVAEGGSGNQWFPAFQAAEPNAVLGSIGGALLPGATSAASFMVDRSVNRFFTFGSMVIPSNDLFIGNDDPMEYELFDTNGNLAINTILQTTDEIWDANSEIADPLAAAFLVGGTNALRTAEGGLVAFDSSELSAYNGLTTAAGYTFNSSLASGADIYRISFSVTAVPEPTSTFLVGVGLAVAGYYRRRTHCAKNIARRCIS